MAATGTIAATVAARGGFTSLSQALFVVLAGGCLLLAAPSGVPRSPRLAAALLAALAALTALSGAWSVTKSPEALRWAAVVGGYGALVLVGAMAARHRSGPAVIAAGACAVATLSALAGMIAVALRVEPFAERIGGTWRPGGPLEFPPALALLVVAVLPALLWAMTAGPRRQRPVAGAVGALAGATLALADSRLQLVLAVTVVGLMVVAAPGRIPARRLVLGAAGTLIAGAGAVSHLLLGAYSSPGERGQELGRALAVVGLLVVAAAIWPKLHSLITRRGASTCVLVVALVCCAIAALGVVTVGTVSVVEGQAVAKSSGFGHGRAALWFAAVEAAKSRPLLGVGAGSYYEATVSLQGRGPSRFVHNLPLEAAAELGLPGLGLVLAIYLVSLLGVWRARASPAAWLLGPGVVAFLISNLLDWSWHLPGLAALWAVCLGAVLSARRAGQRHDLVRSDRPKTKRG